MLNWVFQLRSVSDNPGPLVALLLAFYLLFAMLLVALTPRPPAMRSITTLFLALGIFIPGIFFGLMLVAYPHPLTDVSGTVNAAAELFSRGLNPYLSFNALDALTRSGLDPATAGTHLSDGTLVSVYNYPPGSFLLLMPFYFVLRDIRIISWLLLIALAIIAGTRIAASYRPLVWIPLLLVPGYMLLLGGGITEPAVLLPLFLAWHLRGTRWWGALMIAVACLIKQNAWFYFPFYILLVWREQGLKVGFRQALIAGGLFLLVSLPFAWSNWTVYTGSLLAPMTEPLGPSGEGLGGLVAAGLIALPRWLPAILQIMIALLCVVALMRSKQHLVLMSIAFPMLPLLVAWRSLLSYFLFSGYLVLLVYLAELSNRSEEQDIADTGGAMEEYRESYKESKS